MPSERVQRRIDRLLDRIDAAEAEERWEEVRSLALDVLDVDPENDESAAYLKAAERRIGSQPPHSQEAVQQTVDAASDQPTSFVNGRYEVKGSLGEGGKKIVYLAHDATLDRDVAFALIKTEGLDDASRLRVTREAQAMGRLGDNPNIMPIFDLGDENGQPYMVQPLMVGGDVEALIEDAADGRLSLEEALRIASEICRGLEFAHSKGIIHRDLKPGNVWLTDDGTVRIGDFGLALSIDRSRLTQEKMMVGTVSYMPPEQATGGEITPKADLYSLGAMLYEMTTGRPPFMGDDEIAIIGQHINTPPVAPQWHRPEIPATLDSLIMRMLSKNPAERPDSAADVLSALEAIDVQESGADGSPPSPLGGEDSGEGASGSLDSMASGVFVGRHREMDQLKALLENALSGRGGMVTLVGEPGIGKSRTSQELETYAGLRNATVLWGRCYEGTGAPPYWPWVQAIRSYVSSREPDELRKEMGSTASVIAEIVEDVRERLPEVQAPGQMEDPDSARFRLFDSIATFLKNAAQARPIVLVLDDLHWADKPSLLLLEFIARELSGSRILLIGTYRDMELNRRHPLSITLGDLTRERLFERVLLRGLSREDVARFIEIAAGVAPPRGLVDAVQTQTEGNPLFVTETVRLLIQEGDLTQDLKNRSDSSWNIRIPEGVREVIGRRLDRLSERCNEVLTVASIIGRQFAIEQLNAVLNSPESDEASRISDDRLLDVLDEGLNSRVIEELPDRLGWYQYTHAVVQETLAEELSATRTVRMHARIALALESLHGDGADEHAEELVEHFAEAETVLGVDGLLRYSVIAGRNAIASYGFFEALRQFERALEAERQAPDDLLRAEILAGLGHARSVLTSRDDAQAAWELLVSAAEIYITAGERIKAAEAIAVPIPRFADLTGHSQVLRDALEWPEPGSLLQGRIYSRLCVALVTDVLDTEGAREAANEAISIAERHSAPALEADARANACIVPIYAGQYPNAIEPGKKAIALAVAAGEPNAELRARAWTAFGMVAAGEFEGVREVARGAFSLYERTGSTFFRPGFLALNMQAAWSTGDVSELDLTLPEDLEEGSGGGSGILVAVPALIRASTGDFDDLLEIGRRELVRFLENPDSASARLAPATILPVLGSLLSGDREMLPNVRRALSIENLIVPAFGQDIANGAAAIVASIEDDAELAEMALQGLETSAASFLPFNGTAVPRLRGLAKTVLRQYESAEGEFESSLELCRRTGARGELAWTCSDYAEMLLKRDEPERPQKATELQDEAIAIAQELGMRPLLERVLAQREILKA